MDGITGNVSYAYYFAKTPWKTGEAFAAAVTAAVPDTVRYVSDGSFDQAYIKDMQTAEDFLHGGGQTYEAMRFFLTDRQPDYEAARFSGWCAMLSYLPNSGILVISFHCGFENRDSDELIKLRQCGWRLPIPFADGEKSCEELKNRLCAKLRVEAEPTEQSYLLEITRFGGEEDIDAAVLKHADLLYGLLTGDEGYAFVPPELVKERLCYSWGSRDFIRLFAFGQGFVFFNLLNGQEHDRYLERQRAYGTAQYGGVNPYFLMGSCPLTVNHGILFSVEFVMVIKCLVTGIISYQGSIGSTEKRSFYKRIRETRDFRRRVIIALEKVEGIGITEIGEMNVMLMESQHIAPIVEKVKYLLELLESDLELMYSERNNILVTALTVMGLVLAGVQVLLAVLSLI